MPNFLNIIETECSCAKCQNMCRRPCWGTPGEIQKIIDAGFADRLMADYWSGDEDIEEDILILCGANKEYEGKKAPFYPKSDYCTFFNEGKCELHELRLKPVEGRVADCKDDHHAIDVHTQVALTWNNPEAQAMANSWLQAREIDTDLDMEDLFLGTCDLIYDILGIPDAKTPYHPDLSR